MNTIDTRDLIERRNELKEEIFSALEEVLDELFTKDEIDGNGWLDYDDVDWDLDVLEDFGNTWAEEFEMINDIYKLEGEIGSEFTDGVQLIAVDDFEDYCEELVEDLGYIPKDFPSWIVVDWKQTASNVIQDYSEIEFEGVNYLYIAQ